MPIIREGAVGKRRQLLQVGGERDNGVTVGRGCLESGRQKDQAQKMTLRTTRDLWIKYFTEITVKIERANSKSPPDFLDCFRYL